MIRVHQVGAKTTTIPIFSSGAPKGPFWPVFGPQGTWGQSENANFATTQKPLLKIGPTQLEY